DNTFDRRDRGAVGLRHEASAGFDRPLVQIDRAGAAMAGVAANMRAGEVELLAQEMDQQRARLGKALDLAPIDPELYVHLRHDDSLPRPVQLARSLARWIARCTMMPATWL